MEIFVIFLIFIDMSDLDKYLNRRIWTDGGIMYFCRICGKYLPQDQFYKRKDSKWGLDSKCKLHYKKMEKEDDDAEMDYLKLSPLKESDFIHATELLQLLGYDTTKNIHEQFKKRNNL